LISHSATGVVEIIEIFSCDGAYSDHHIHFFYAKEIVFFPEVIA